MRTKCPNPWNRAFTLVEIMVVVTIIGLLAVIAVTNFMIARDSSRLKVIQTNLRQIEEAKEQWAFETKQRDGAPVGDVSVLQDFFRGGRIRVVVHETYNPNPVGTPATAALPADVKLGPYAARAIIPAP